MQLRLNGEAVDALSFFALRDRAPEVSQGKRTVDSERKQKFQTAKLQFITRLAVGLQMASLELRPRRDTEAMPWDATNQKYT